MSSPPPLPLDNLRDRFKCLETRVATLEAQVTRLEIQVKELRRQQPTVKGDRWRLLSLSIAGLAALIVATPGAIETRWVSVENQGTDAVGLVGAIAAAYGVWRGRQIDQRED